VAQVRDRAVFSVPERELLMAMCAPPADGAANGRVYFIWYHGTRDDGELRDLFTDEAGRHHGLSIPPPLIRPQLVEALKHHAHEVLPPPIAAVVAATRQPLLQAISDMETPRMALGRVALLGDSAFVACPHVAAGASKAALDASALVAALADADGDVPSALLRYEANRIGVGRQLVAHSRYLGAHLEGNSAGFDPVKLMSEYGHQKLRMLTPVDPNRLVPTA
jgi:2-polyprenyl-6-methoxyphenol hydroxylase-like FAD-dependent oxidoreductase